MPSARVGSRRAILCCWPRSVLALPSDQCWSAGVFEANSMPRVFLLSPANCSGRRAKQVLSPRSSFDLAERLRSREGAPLGDVFAFVSGLYFRGKLTYARRFAAPPDPECP